MKDIFDILPKELVSDMKNTEQDSIYHAEGNVWIHTTMVLDAASKLPLFGKDMEILQYAALFHDIGKTKCTRVENGRITSRGHSRISYHLAKEILDPIDMPFEDKLQILNLVRLHGNPHYAHTRGLEKEVIKMSMDCNLKLLYYLATADYQGRICSDYEETMLNLEIFKECAEGLDCFDKPYEFKSDLAKFNCLVKGTHHFSDEPFDDTGSEVVMMCGLPGSGKDTYIKKLKACRSWNVISLDEIRKELKIKPTDEQGLVINTAKERAKEFLRKKENFIWNATNTNASLREGLINLFKTYDAFISIFYIHASLDKALQQNKNRSAVVPDQAIERMFRGLEIPSQTEAHKVIYIF